MKSLLLILLTLVSAAAWAHKPSDAYLALDVQTEGVAGRWDIALRDLDYAIGLDANDDGVITWGELRRGEGELAAYALARLSVSGNDAPCPLEPTGLLVDDHTDGKYAVLQFTARCPLPLHKLAMDYRLFRELDPQHRGLLRLTDGAGTKTAVLGPGDARRSFELADTGGGWRERSEFVREGVGHIWTGYDHILFLLSLLLPAVLVRQDGAWRPAPNFRHALGDVVAVVTAFTLAHSVTLSLASLGYLDLPSRWVESAIAASVAAAALNNLLPVFHGRRPWLAFAFGLVHGLGFAAVLSDLALPHAARLWSLLGFNAGVELGQLAIVGVFLPLAWGLSRLPVYRAAVLQSGSVAIALLAGVWLLERGLDIRILGFAG